MNLKKWQTLVRRLSRLFYAEPLYYLLIDYLIEHTFVEKQTFAQQHSLESSTKKIEACLNHLVENGLVSSIKVKTDKFKNDWARKIGFQNPDDPNEIKIDS
jgi:hypothetical protein